eukprot:CAMPEP_0116979278 /NCGR_PEP_ID=MMETSP0467-20121206/58339_1 /TAXON_ID=283647 /ORGANISM="Mesodinium pulex, Strain SPMC105" /LENGTH=89 /DNA_ID=CAMNT_0004672923 /DNA_START=298 /DNA_END=567 /DNA_ORIENTATION=+
MHEPDAMNTSFGEMNDKEPLNDSFGAEQNTSNSEMPTEEIHRMKLNNDSESQSERKESEISGVVNQIDEFVDDDDGGFNMKKLPSKVRF